MKRISKRSPAVLSALMMLCAIILLFGASPAGAQTYEFITQPESVSINPDTLQYIVTWETNFTPVELNVERWTTGGPGQSDGYRNYDTVREGLSAQGSYRFGAAAGGELYRIRLKYDSQAPGITSDPFFLHNGGLNVVAQPPAQINIDPDTLTYPVTWETNFTPKKVYIQYYSSGGPGQGPGYKNYDTITEGLSRHGSYNIGMGGKDKTFKVVFNYGSLETVATNIFFLSDSNLEFTSQPDGTVYMDPETLTYPIDWETNFTPTKTYIRRTTWATGNSKEEIYDTLPGTSSRARHYELPASVWKDGVPYWLRAVYDSGGMLTVSSKKFYLSDASLKFTSQPDSTIFANPDDGTFPVYWETNFVPVKVEIMHKGLYGSATSLVTISSPSGKKDGWALDTGGSTSGSYYVRAYYSDIYNGEKLYVESEPFRLHAAPDFTKQPVSAAYAEDDGSCTIRWNTNFDPVSINIIGIGEDGQPLSPPLTYFPDADDKAYDLTLPDGMDSCAFQVCAYYKPGYSVKSSTFSVNKLRYTRQPAGGTADAKTGRLGVNWETNFTPLRYEILKKEGDTYAVTDTILPNNGKKRSYGILIDTESEENIFTYKIRSYYNDEVWADSQEIEIRNPVPVTLTLAYPQSSLTGRSYTLLRGQSANEYLGSLPLGTLQSVTIEGWYADAGFTVPYTGDEPVETDTTIYGKTNSRYYTVTFVTNGGSSISPLHLPYNSVIDAPTPVRTDYLFGGWYLNSALTDNFNRYIHLVNGDRTLYAKWIPDGIAINEANFPDEIFRTRYVTEKFDTNGDGTLTSGEIANVTSITGNFSNLTSLQGIEYFTALESLTMLNSKITSLDLSANTGLTFLRLDGSSLLTSLNIENCSLLTDVLLPDCGLKKLDVTMLPALVRLTVNGNAQLEQLYVNGSQLEGLVLFGTAVESLDLSGCAPLAQVYRYAPTDYDTYESHRGTVNSKLRILTLDKDVTVYLPGDCVEINETNFPDENFRSYVKTQFDTGGNGWLNPEEIAAVDMIFLMDSENSQDGPIGSLKGMEFFTQLTDLYAVNVGLPEVDLSGNLLLKTVYLENDDLERIDVSMLPSLETLDVNGNERLEEAVLGNSPVKSMRCHHTGLTLLDLGGCPYLAIAALESEPRLIEDEGPGYLKYFLQFENPDPNGLPEYYYELSVDPDTEFLLPDAVRINEANFPDETFRSYVTEYFDTEADGWLSKSEIAAVTGIYCRADSLKGIEFFTELEELECYGSSEHRLSELDLRANRRLTYVECVGHDLTELLLDGLTELSVLDCSDNALTELDVSGLPALEALFCSGNDMTHLDVTGCPLTELYCQGNPLKELVTGGQDALRILYCYDTPLAELDLSECPLLCGAVLSAAGNEGADYTGKAYLQYYDAAQNVRLRVDPVMRLLVPGGLPLTEEYFPDAAFRAYIAEQFDTNSNGWLSDAEREQAESINCEDLGITTLEGIEYLPGLRSAYFGSNPVTEVNLSGNPLLETVNCEGAQSLQKLELTGLTQLTALYITGTSITEPDLAGLENLTTLHCGDTPLTRLDVSENSGLCELNAQNLGSLSELVLGEQNSLYELVCDGTPVDTLDLTGCPILTGLLSSAAPEDVGSGNIGYRDDTRYMSFYGGTTVYSMAGAAFPNDGKQIRLSPGQTVRLPAPQVTVYHGDPAFRYLVSGEGIAADSRGVLTASAGGRYTLTAEFDGHLLGSCDIYVRDMDTVQLPGALQVIEEEAFAGDGSMERVVIGPGAVSIGSRAFADAVSLCQAFIPQSVTSIDASAFENADPTIVCAQGSAAHQFAAGLDMGYVFEE